MPFEGRLSYIFDVNKGDGFTLLYPFVYPLWGYVLLRKSKIRRTLNLCFLATLSIR